MILLGISYNTGSNGTRYSTLYVQLDFDAYYNDPEAGRGCIGVRAEAISVGAYDTSNLKPGMHIESSFDPARTSKTGKTFQSVKKIEILK